MKYPAMRGTGKYRVEVPQLSGGTNMADAAQRVEDNQLTDSLNVWWHDNLLQTRPGLTKTGNAHADTDYTTVQVINEQETFLMHHIGYDSSTNIHTMQPEMISTRGNPSYVPKGNGKASISHRGFDSIPNTMMVRAPKNEDTEWYLFSSGAILKQKKEAAEDEVGFEPVTDTYVPTVLVNGKGNASADGMTGTLFEGYNLLTNQFKAKFTTDGAEQSNIGYSGSYRFKMPVNIETASGATLEIQFTEDTYTITMEGDAASDYMVGSVQIKPKYVGDSDDTAYPIVYLDAFLYANGILEFYATRKNSSGGSSTKIDGIPAASIANNLTVTAYSSGLWLYDREKILSMTRCCWFGGDRSGLAGGTRLFVCGNPEYPNLVHWSDVNNPLYFPENNYAYVGDSSQAVTGFGKQGDLLLIFKQSEIYAAQYVAGQSYTAADVENGKVVDVAAYAAQFPLTPIHPTVGCDCPDTIRLVNNRLCWADSRGYIYMLPTVNQYNERVVREIGGNIRRALTGHTEAEWESAGACEYCGHYMLTVGKRAYLLETNNSSFSSYTYYAKETSAQRLLPWYIWEFPQAIAAVAGDRDTVKLAAGAYVYRLSGKTDDGEPIHSRFVTKLFDFGRSQAGKAIHQLYITMADAGGRVRVSYLTEDYTAEDAYLLEANGDEQPNTAGYFKPFRLSPNLHRIREFGIRCESEGTMAVSGISIDYTIQGVVR